MTDPRSGGTPAAALPSEAGRIERAAIALYEDDGMCKWVDARNETRAHWRLTARKALDAAGALSGVAPEAPSDDLLEAGATCIRQAGNLDNAVMYLRGFVMFGTTSLQAAANLPRETVPYAWLHRPVAPEPSETAIEAGAKQLEKCYEEWGPHDSWPLVAGRVLRAAYAIDGAAGRGSAGPTDNRGIIGALADVQEAGRKLATPSPADAALPKEDR